MKIIRYCLVFILLPLSMLGCSGPETTKVTGLSMGTVITLIFPKGMRPSSNIVDKAFSEIERIDRLMSDYDGDSEISRLNRLNPRERTEISSDTYKVLSKSIEVSRKTEGAFDVTAAPLVKLWGFRGDGPRKIPSRDMVRAYKGMVDYRNIDIYISDKGVSFSGFGTEIDLGGIAKGYAIDRAAAALAGEGVRSVIVDAGGDMYCLGRRDDGNRWKVGIRDPRDKNKLFATLELEDKAIATSGSYENFVMIDGKRYSHIIDPRTGYPADNGVLSVSIIADDAMTADSMATAVFVMGRERGMEFVRRDAGLEAVIIYEDGGETKMEISEGLKGKVSIL